jgi:head-tail adaptor
MIAAGVMSERVSILVPEAQRGKYGELKMEYQDRKRVWARVQFARGSAVITSGEEWLKHSITVTLRNNSVINERCRLLWDRKMYGIDSMNRIKADGTVTIVGTYIDEGYEQWAENRKEDEE